MSNLHPKNIHTTLPLNKKSPVKSPTPYFQLKKPTRITYSASTVCEWGKVDQKRDSLKQEEEAICLCSKITG